MNKKSGLKESKGLCFYTTPADKTAIKKPFELICPKALQRV